MSLNFKNVATPHCHPQSFDSGSTPQAFAKREVELGTGTLTVTDHGSMAACRTVYDLAKKNGLTGIIGIEGYFRDDNCPILKKHGIEDAKAYGKYFHVTLHARDEKAYHKLCEKISLAPVEKHGSEAKPLFNWQDLEEIGAQNTSIMSGCLVGMVQRHVLDHGNTEIAEAYMDRLSSLARPGNFAVEVFPHACTHNWMAGVFLTLGDGTTHKYYSKKKFRLKKHGEILAADLAKLVKTKKWEGDFLIGIMNNRKWQEMDPVAILTVDHKEEFIANECTENCPNGDVQEMCNRFVIDLANKKGHKIVVSDDSHFANKSDKIVQDIRLQQSGSWRFFGCFERSTPVDMADGTSKRICDISVGDIVKSFDFKSNRVVHSRVAATIPTPSSKESFIVRQFYGQGLDHTARRRIIVTPNHHFWDGGSWTEIADTATACVRASAPSKELQEALDGTMLGDACVALAGAGCDTPYFTIGHSDQQDSLVLWWQKIFGGGLRKKDATVKVDKRGMKWNSTSCSTTSSAHPMFTEVRRRWYPEGKKIVPRDLKLTPRMLAWWYMDDGSVCIGHNRTGGQRRKTPLEKYRLYTNGFTQEDVEFLASLLLSEFGIESKVYSYTMGPFIQMNKENGRKLTAIVAPYVLPQIQYKCLGVAVGAQSEIDPWDGETVFATLHPKEVAAGQHTGLHSVDYSVKYDLSIEETACYFVNGILVHNSYYRKNSNEMYDYFKDMGVGVATFESWLDNNQEWSEGFKDFEFTDKVELPTKFYPENSLLHLKSLINKHGRMDWNNSVYVDRLMKEIELFNNNGVVDLLPYFFVPEEVCDLYSKNDRLTGPGRGSSGGVLIAYLLGITHIDPIRYGLSLERFLTKERIASGKYPDIDGDLSDRELLVGAEGKGGWLHERFGDHMAQISVDTTLKLRSAAKDVARIVHGGTVPVEIENLTKKFTNAPQGITDKDFVFGYEANGSWVAGSIESDEALQQYIEKYPDEWEIVQKSLGLVKNKGRHACAFAIGNRPLHTFMPMMKVSDVEVTQYTASGVEASGVLKYDFLIITVLNDIKDCIELVQNKSGLTIPEIAVIDNRNVPRTRLLPIDGGLKDIWDLPEDQNVFRETSESKTETVFQFSTPSAKQWLHHFNHWKDKDEGRKSIDSIMAMATFTALDRPGPLDAYVEDEAMGLRHNMLVEYARRARYEPPVGEVSTLTAILPKTFGTLCFQEDLQKAYQVLMDCSGSEAEEFRSNVAKKKMDKVLKAYGPWMEKVGAKYGSAEAERIWGQFVTFGQYGFCIDGDQMVVTSGGSKKMKDVSTQDFVLGVNELGQQMWHHPNSVWSSGEKEVFEVILEDGSSIMATKDHQFLCEDGWHTLDYIINNQKDLGTLGR